MKWWVAFISVWTAGSLIQDCFLHDAHRYFVMSWGFFVGFLSIETAAWFDNL